MGATTAVQERKPREDPSAMARRKPPTKPVRLYEDIADLANQLSGVFKMDVADFLAEPLRKYLEKKRVEAANILMKDRPRDHEQG